MLIKQKSTSKNICSVLEHMLFSALIRKACRLALRRL